MVQHRCVRVAAARYLRQCWARRDNRPGNLRLGFLHAEELLLHREKVLAIPIRGVQSAESSELWGPESDVGKQYHRPKRATNSGNRQLRNDYQHTGGDRYARSTVQPEGDLLIWQAADFPLLALDRKFRLEPGAFLGNVLTDDFVFNQQPAPQIAVRGFLAVDLNVQLAGLKRGDLSALELERTGHLALDGGWNDELKNRLSWNSGGQAQTYVSLRGGAGEPRKGSIQQHPVPVDGGDGAALAAEIRMHRVVVR